MPTCPCTRPVTDAYLCSDCTRTLTADLNGIADLATVVDVARARYGAIRYTHGRPGHTATSTLPHNPAVTPAATEALTAVRGLCTRIRDNNTRGLPHSIGPADLPRAASWAANRTGLIRTRPDAPHWHAAITRAHRRLADALDVPPDQLYLGECGNPTDSDGPRCATPVYVATSTITRPGRRDEQTPDSAYTRCRTCDAQHDVHARRAELLAGLAVYQATIRELGALLPLLADTAPSRATLYRLTQTGDVPAVGARLEANSRGEWRRVATYRISDVHSALNATKRHQTPPTST